MPPRQVSMLPPPILDHGGEVRKGKRKLFRPLDPKRPVHLVLRSSRARGTRSLLVSANKAFILHLAHELAEKYFIKIHRFSNVGTHLHLLVSFRRRESFQHFLRHFAGMIAFKISGAKKGEKKGRFWDTLIYSRVIHWGKHFKQTALYIAQNTMQALGFDRDAIRLISLSLMNAGVLREETGPP